MNAQAQHYADKLAFEIDSWDLSVAFAAGERVVVIDCDGIGCNASTKGALNMSRLGFRVKELIGGLDWWKRDGHPTHGETAQAAGTACGCNEKRSEKEESR